MGEVTKVCCICKKTFSGYGNDPWPVEMDPDAVCCDACDMSVVLQARLKEMKEKGA